MQQTKENFQVCVQDAVSVCQTFGTRIEIEA